MNGIEQKDRNIKLVGAVTQAFRILRVLADNNEPQGANVIARNAKVNPSTAFNILRTLVAEDAAQFDSLSKTYTLGEGLLKLSGSLLKRKRTVELMAELNQLASETGCLIGLWQVGMDRMILLERAVADRPMRLDMQVKQRMPLMLGAVGRALAAHRKLSVPKLREHFKALRWEGTITANQYVQQVQDAAKQGYGIDREALYPGVVSVSTLVLNRDGDAVYGLTASGFTASLDEKAAHDIGQRLVTIAHHYE